MTEGPRNYHGKYLLTLVFASILISSLGMLAPNVFAMGQNGCITEYDGPFISFTINNGTKTFDALANPGVTFNSASNFTVTFVIHTPSINSENNSNTGSAWYGEDVYGYENGHCVGSVGPNQNVTVSQTVSNQHPYGGYTQSILFDTRASSSATFNVQWQSSPSIPQNLQATAGNSQVSLSWSAPVDNGGYPVTNYKIYRSTTSGNETLLTEMGSVTSYNDTSVTNGQTYFYKVTAVNSVGESPQSNEVSAMLTSPTTSPQSPTGLTATAASASQINLSWTTPSSNGGSSITNYKVYRGTTSGNETLLIKTGNVTSYNDTSVTSGQTYFYKVSAVNSVGESAPSNEASAMPFADTVTTTIPVSNSPFDIAVNSNTNKIYVADIYHDTVSVIDGSTNSVVTTFGSRALGAIAVNSNTDKIYVTDVNSGGTVSVIDGVTNQVMSTIPVGYEPNGVAINSNTNTVYVSNFGGSVSVINGTTNNVTNTISIGNHLPSFIAVNSKTNMVYVVSNKAPATSGYSFSNDNTVSIINATTNNVIGTVTVGISPYGVAVNPNTNEIYVDDNGGDNRVFVIDGTTNSVSGSIQVGSNPTDIAINPNNNMIYVTNFGSNTVSIINGSNNSVLTTVAVGSQPYGVGVNPNTNRIYVANSNSNSVSVIDGNSSSTPTVPSAPQNLQSTAGNSQVSLSWTAPSNNGGSPITGYQVERSNNTGTTWFTVQSNTGSTATTYNDTGLAPSTTYTYRVSAINSVGTSSPSNTASATTQAATPPTGITLDNIQSTSGTVSSSPYQITLGNFNTGTGTNNLLVVGISANNNNVASVTFGGVSLTKKVSSFSNNDAEFWYLKNPSGTGNIVVTMAGATSAVVGAYSFSGVDQTIPIPTSTANHNSAAGSPTITITTTNPNDWVLDLPSIYGGITLGSPTCTQQWDTNIPHAITGASSSAVQTTSGSVTCKWTASSGDMWDDAAIEVKASSTGAPPPTTPGSPTGLGATAASSSQINLSWTAPSNSGSSSITGYKIERSTDSGTTWSTIPSNTGSTSTTYSDSGLASSTSYTYRVSATNSAGTGSPSNVSSATTPSNITAPSPPTGLGATTASSSQINLSWTIPSSNGGSAITGYDVERSVNNGNTWSTVVSNTGSTNPAYNDTGLSAGTYTYRVSAINSVGSSSPSNTASATTGTVPTNGITVSNVQSTSGSTSPSNPIMIADFDVGTGNNRLLVVGVSADNSNVGSITFGGVPLAKKASSFSNNDAEFWYLKNPTGTGAIVVTMTGSTSAIVGAYSFSGVNQSSPLPTSVVTHNSAASSPTISITTKFANDLVLDLPSIYGGTTLGSPTCTSQWDTNMPGTITGASSSKVVPTPGAVTCKWTASSADLWDDAAVEIAASK